MSGELGLVEKEKGEGVASIAAIEGGGAWGGDRDGSG